MRFAFEAGLMPLIAGDMRAIVFAAALGLGSPADVARADPWPEFRGLHRSGVARNGSFPTHFGPETNCLWSVPVPKGHASPIVWGDHLVLTGFEDNQLVTLVVDPLTGRERWRRSVAPGRIEPGSRLSHPATATPATNGRIVVAYFAPFGLIAYDFAGNELWRHPLPTPVTQHGASSSPTLAGDLVLQLCDQDAGSYLLAVDAGTGAVRWRADRPAARRGFSTPLPWPPGRPDEVIVAGTLSLVAYALEDGTAAWTVRGLPNEMVSSPIPGEGHIHVAGWTPSYGVDSGPAWAEVLAAGDADGDGRLTRREAPAGPARQHFHYMDANADGVLERAEYESILRIFTESRNAALAVRPGGRGEVTTTHVTWRQTRGLPYVPTPLLYGGRLYLVKNGGLITCLDASSGEALYQEERLGALGDNYSSPVAADGRILVISQPGTAVVLRAGDALDVLARNDLGEDVLATPAIVGNTLFVRTVGRLLAFREGAGP